MVLVNRYENRRRVFFPRCCLDWNNCIHSCSVSIEDDYRVGEGAGKASGSSKLRQFVISSIRREADENCALLGSYTASRGNYLPTFQDKLSVPSSRVNIIDSQAQTRQWNFELQRLLQYKPQNIKLAAPPVNWMPATAFISLCSLVSHITLN